MAWQYESPYGCISRNIIWRENESVSSSAKAKKCGEMASMVKAKAAAANGSGPISAAISERNNMVKAESSMQSILNG